LRVVEEFSYSYQYRRLGRKIARKFSATVMSSAADFQLPTSVLLTYSHPWKEWDSGFKQ
jgi:hypothetical protein